MIILQILAVLLVFFAGIVCAYHLFLAFVALTYPAPTLCQHGDLSHSFAIIVPAHNEERSIAGTLASCAAIDYPIEKFTVFVIVDNCEDATEHISRQFGANCLVRHDPDNRGKGFALAWGIPQVLNRPFDGILILDADCTVDPQVLQVADSCFAHGHRALQTSNCGTNLDDSAISYVLAVANRLENDFFDAPKSALGLASGLRGTGMILRRDVLQEFPWQAHSVVEDSEYTYQLFMNGISVHFLPNVRVISRFPVERQQLAVQRTRWIAGIHIAMRKGIRLFGEGVRTRRLLLLDAGFSTLVAGRFLVIFELLAAMMLTSLCWIIIPSSFNGWLFAITLIIAVVYIIYSMLGVIKVGINLRRLSLLVRAPLVISRYLAMSVTAVLGGAVAQWHRTPRI